MKTNSLAFRLFATAAAWVLLVLPVAGAIIYSLYRQEVETSFDRRTRVLLTVVLSGRHRSRRERARRPQGRRRAAVRDHPFGLVLADQAARHQAGPAARPPRSLPASTIPLPERAERRAQRPRDPLGQPRGAAGAEAARRRDHLRVRRGQEGAALLRRRRRHAGRDGGEPAPFRTRLSLALALAGVGLLAVTLFQIRFGLLPLHKVEKGLAAIRSGEADAARCRPAAGDRAAAARAQRAPQVQPGDRRARPHPRRQSRPRPEDAAGRHRQRGARRSLARSRAR